MKSREVGDRSKAFRLFSVVVALATILALGSAPSSGQASGPTPLKIVLIGDSYSAGNGAGDYGGPQGCYRSSSNWAERYVDTLQNAGYAPTLINRACSGGVASNITSDRRIEAEYVKAFDIPVQGQWQATDPGLESELVNLGFCSSKYPEEEYFTFDITDALYDPLTNTTLVNFSCDRWLKPQIDAVGRDTDLVLFTIGGNDAGFSKIVEDCFALFARDEGQCIERVEFAENLVNGGTLRARVRGILDEVHTKMRDDARIVLASYPYLEAGTGYSLGSYAAADEVRALGDSGDTEGQGAVDDFNSSIGFSQAVFVGDIKTHFIGHEPFGSPFDRNPDRWIWEFERGLLPGQNIFENYHPNPTGHQEWANVLAGFGAFGAAGSPLGGDIDIVFVIDTTGSMSDDITAVKDFAGEFVDLLTASATSYRFALVTYRDHPEHTGDPSDYPSRVDLNFTDDPNAIVNSINAISVNGGGDFAESVYSGLMEGIGLSWRPGVKKMVLQLGDAPPHDPEPVTGLIADDVVAAAFAVDPAEVYVLDVSSGGTPSPLLVDIADRTGGGVFSATSPSEVAAALIDAVEEALAKPFAWAGGPYVTTVGTPIVLDGSGSVDRDGIVISYEWDLDGDGVFDTFASEPTYTHTYGDDFDGIIALRVTDDSGLTSIGTARAHASSDGDEVPPEQDNCPDDPNHGQSDFDEDGIGDICDPDPGFDVDPDEGSSTEVFFPTDAYVWSAKPNLNYDDELELAVSSRPQGGGSETQALLQFDLSSLPINATVESAELSLHTLADVDDGLETDVWTITGLWDPETVTWNARPSLGGEITTVDLIADAEATIDMTSVVQGWINDPGSNNGIALLPSTSVTHETLIGAEENDDIICVPPEDGSHICVLVPRGDPAVVSTLKIVYSSSG